MKEIQQGNLLGSTRVVNKPYCFFWVLKRVNNGLKWLKNGKKTRWNFFFLEKMPYLWGGEGSEGEMAKDHTFSLFWNPSLRDAIVAQNRLFFTQCLTAPLYLHKHKANFLRWMLKSTKSVGKFQFDNIMNSGNYPQKAPLMLICVAKRPQNNTKSAA